jgi:hypothetical protein
VNGNRVRGAALAVACIGCTPVVSPTTRPDEPALERAPDVSRPQSAATQLLDASVVQEDAADAFVDAAPPPVRAVDNPLLHSWDDQPAPTETASDAERRRLRGSAADVHTPEGAARGYRVYRHCPNYLPDGVAVAIVGTGTKAIPQLGSTVPRSGTLSSVEIEREFRAFASAAQRAAAVSSIHGGAAGRPCFDLPGGDAVVLYLHDWRQVDQAIVNLGTWLSAHDWKGDVILWPQPIPGPTYSK